MVPGLTNGRLLVFLKYPYVKPSTDHALLLDLRPIDTLDKRTLKLLPFESVVQRRHQCLELLLQLGASVKFETPSGDSPAYTVQWMLGRFKTGSPTALKLGRIKKLMEERGATFLAPDPQEVREQRKANGG